MASMIRWSPITDIMRWNWDLDEFFRDFMEPVKILEESSCVCPRVESYWKNGSYVIKADLPGVEAKDIQVTLENGCLTIKGERKMDKEVEDKNVDRREVFYGSFERSMAVPEGLRTEQIKAKYHEGVLEITVPVEEKLLPKKIKVEEGKN